MTPDQLAEIGDYVLDLLDGPERAAFEARLASDPALAAAVSRVQQQFQALDDTATPQPASPALWQSIERALDATPHATATVIPLRRRLPPVQWLGLMAASVAVALGVGYFTGASTSTARQPLMVAVLLNESDNGPGAIVEAYADDTVRLLPLENFVVPAGQVMQVWTLPDADTGPVSLGTLTQSGAMTLAGPDLPLPATGQLYEITLEPAPGSPTGRPTGPILVKGFAKPPAI
ncbi:anti-sigma factor [Devosia beringensis]|uniref:anti-sigma factor n=1 Tax=Devosia beringensis TaxID=2657486 RepID=UPI00186B9091|nr:anti-sigma factor [Devosia beringensis]